MVIDVEMLYEITFEQLLLAVVGICTLAITYKAYFYITNRSPPGPWGLPLVGHLPLFGSNPPTKFIYWSKKYGDIFYLRMGSWPAIVLNSRQSIREALVEQSEIFSDRPEFFSSKVVRDMTSLTFGSYTKRWQLHSKIASSVLRNCSNRPCTEQIISQAAEDMVQQFLETNQKYFDPREIIFLSVGSIVYQICYGHDKNCQTDSGFINFINHTRVLDKFASTGNPVDVMPWLRYVIPQKANQFVDIMKTFHDSVFKIINERMKTCDKNHNFDIMSGLIEAGKKYSEDSKNNHGITRNEIMSSLQDFLGGGFMTVSTTIEWIILYLAHYKDIQTKVQTEIDDVIGSRSVVWQDADKMPFTQATILEIQRISPVTCIVIPHATSKDTYLRKYFIKRGTVVLCNFFATTRDAVWEDPESFLPERFLCDNGQISSEKEKAVLSFGVGTRKCPGKMLAKMELFLIVVNIFQHCQIRLESKPDFEGVHCLTYYPKPYRVKISAR